MRVIGVIPVRMGSSRFPGKPLAPLCGLPMIEHVYWRTVMCETLDGVFVATCDHEILERIERCGGRGIMTSSSHARATDRVAEVAREIDVDVIVMVQGDEPMIVPEMIDLALGPLFRDAAVLCTNLAAPIRIKEEFEDDNTIKLVMAQNGDALYFSRRPIPDTHRLPFEQFTAYKQVCVFAFRRDFLLQFASLEPTPLEIAESIDMLRAIEHGYPIRIVQSPYTTHSVDTMEDLSRVDALMQSDPLLARYATLS